GEERALGARQIVVAAPVRRTGVLGCSTRTLACARAVVDVQHGVRRQVEQDVGRTIADRGCVDVVSGERRSGVFARRGRIVLGAREGVAGEALALLVGRRSVVRLTRFDRRGRGGGNLAQRLVALLGQ